MKIEHLNKLKIDTIRDELCHYNREELCSYILGRISDDLLSKVLLEQGSDYEVAVISGDEDSYCWTDETIGDTHSEEEAIAIAEKAVNSGDWQGYTIVILQFPECVDVTEIDADTFEVWRHYVPESPECELTDDELNKFRESFNKYFDSLKDCKDAEDIAWNWAVDVEDVEFPPEFLDEDGNVTDEDELCDYLHKIALRLLEERM